MIEIDGNHGEGGGQIVRSSLALSIVTGQPFRIRNIRAGRKKPGLLRQHLSAVKAAERIGAAHVEGAELGSRELLFDPTGMHGGVYELDIGSAGSANLVLQAVLPALMMADEPSELLLIGGTHNPFAPPFDFLLASYLPLLKRMGVEVRLTLERHGFYPKGGGRLRATVTPGLLGRLELEHRGELHWRRGVATIADLPMHVAERELATLQKELGLAATDLRAELLAPGRGPGNVCRVELQHEHLTVVFTEFGEKGLPAETVAGKLADQVRRFERADVAVDERLADQLLLPMALGVGGCFTTLCPTDHARTQAYVIEAFLEEPITFTELARDRWRIEV